ncbi:ANTAR domain-containing protein [Sanguibacter suaedae]|uniref:ANTAR domain-containing protein n=1 Tax=Sanguibacter suaedae TaxID=2795737 RepID=A0A934I5W1_9MICO|nr:ANTAR domain-containing protein [Sanguibacter suaedae]MBI9116179.1 ANTAR domain-containing protein [Sanguibacter suaedae]
MPRATDSSELLAQATALTVGRFTIDLSTGLVEWTDGMFHIHGFRTGEVRPTLELVLAHKHPEDRARITAQLDTVRASGGMLTSLHRVVAADGAVRTVVVVGEGLRGADGQVDRITGYMADLTETHRDVVDTEVRAAVVAFREHAATIEQAKGILMEVHGVSDDDAFDLLRWHSNSTNTKLTSLSQRLVRYADRRNGFLPETTEPGDDARTARHDRRVEKLLPSPTTRGAGCLDVTWRTMWDADIRITGPLEECAEALDQCVQALTLGADEVRTVHLDLAAVPGTETATTALRSAVTALHRGGITVHVSGWDRSALARPVESRR